MNPAVVSKSVCSVTGHDIRLYLIPTGQFEPRSGAAMVSSTMMCAKCALLLEDIRKAKPTRNRAKKNANEEKHVEAVA